MRVSHAELIVTDLGASRAFYADTLGTSGDFRGFGIICLRAMEERGTTVWFCDKARCRAAATWRSACSLKRILTAAAYFDAQGRAIEWVERPFQGRTLRVLDPHGVPLEFYFAMERLATIHQKYALYRGVPLRIDHFNCFSPHVDESVAFYNEIGFRTTEYTEDKETGRLWAAWMHRKGGVHDIAFTNGIGPRLHHVAFWVPTPMNIIDLLDVMATTGYVDSIERGPGRHGIANAFFLYSGSGRAGLKSTARTTRRSTRTTSLSTGTSRTHSARPCGAPAPKSWFEHGTTFAGTDTRQPDLAAQPIIAP